MKPLFNVPGEGIFALLMGIISGYPVGAKLVSKLKEQNLCNSIECERLIAFTNNSGPLFIIGTVGISLFHSIKIGIILFISHILSSILVGLCFRWWKREDEKKLIKNLRFLESNNTLSFSNLGEILTKSISGSINSIFIVGGFVILFSVICSILQESNLLNFLSFLLIPFFKIFGVNTSLVNSTLMGFIEITNGLSNISVFSYSYSSILITSFLLGFGGISILLQVLSITSKQNISIKPYIIGKLMQAVFSTIITLIFL